MSSGLFPSPADTAWGNSRESVEVAIAFCFLINRYLSFQLFLFSPVPRNRAPGNHFPHMSPWVFSQSEPIWEHPPLWPWGQVQCAWSDAKGGHEFSKLSDQENVTHPHGLERTMPNSKRWFQATWESDHVGQGKREFPLLSSPGFSSHLGSSRMLRLASFLPWLALLLLVFHSVSTFPPILSLT